jgi:hypothetical protein
MTTQPIALAFSPRGLSVPIANIVPLRPLKAPLRMTLKYRQMFASVLEVGIVEPLIIFPEADKSETYVLLDGHVRLEILKQMEQTHAPCLISTDDEAFTYNKRVNLMGTVEEHVMILKATQEGVSEERIAKVLRVDVSTIRKKRDLLNGICEEASELLKTKRITVSAFAQLKKVKPARQIEIAGLLNASGNYSVAYVRALVAGTGPDLFIDQSSHQRAPIFSLEQIAKMEKEMDTLKLDLKRIEESHGNQVLHLVLARGYLVRLLNNVRVARHLSQHHADVFRELKLVTSSTSLEN